MASEITAVSAKAAQGVALTSGLLPRGAILQSVYPADGPVPPLFGGPPTTSTDQPS